MKVTAHQPNYIPWLGYFHKISLSDVFVILDSIQLPRGSSWVTRNRIKTSDGPKWLSVPILKKGRANQKILETKISSEQHSWRRKHWLALRGSYTKAPFFATYSDRIEDLFQREWSHLADLNETIIRFLLGEFGVEVNLLRSSELNVQGMKTDLIIDLCKKSGCSTYIAGLGSSQEYLDRDKCLEHGIDVIKQDFSHPTYPQLHDGFEPNLSALDFLFNCGKDFHKYCPKH